MDEATETYKSEVLKAIEPMMEHLRDMLACLENVKISIDDGRTSDMVIFMRKFSSLSDEFIKSKEDAMG